MTAAISLRCSRCDGRPYLYESGCVRCQDSGQVEVPAIVEPRPVMPESAQEAAWLALRRPLIDARVPDVDAAARHLTSVLWTEPSPVVALAVIRKVGGIGDATARQVVHRYTQAVDEHGRILDRLHRYDRERCRDGERLCQHARRIERCLPPAERWLR